MTGVWLDLFGLGFGWDLFGSWRIWLGFDEFGFVPCVVACISVCAVCGGLCFSLCGSCGFQFCHVWVLVCVVGGLQLFWNVQWVVAVAISAELWPARL